MDLAGSPRRITGLCHLGFDLECVVARAKLDDEILSFIREADPSLVAIDAPLSFPLSGESMRACDKELKKMGLRPLPPVLGPMRMLTRRAIELKKTLEESGYEVIEVFPTGAQKLLDLPSKKDLDALRSGLISLGVKDLPREVDVHVLDAVTCALVGLLYLRGEYLEVGKPGEGIIVLPKPRDRR